MRTARNIFIALLAVADLTICLLTMPMTMVGVLAKYWPFGPSTWYVFLQKKVSWLDKKAPALF